MIKLVLTQAQARIVDRLLGNEQTKLRKSANSLREQATTHTGEDIRQYCERWAVIQDNKADNIAAIRGKAEYYEADNRRAAKDATLPTIAELSGSDPNFTGGLSTKEYMDEIRGRNA